MVSDSASKADEHIQAHQEFHIQQRHPMVPEQKDGTNSAQQGNDNQ
jgi:hypothetical protein